MVFIRFSYLSLLGVTSAVEHPWTFSNQLYSEYDSCENGKHCPAHPYYPFNVSESLSKRVTLPALNAPWGAERYEEMGISLAPRKDMSFDFYYRANFPPIRSDVRTGILDQNLQLSRSIYSVPGIPWDPFFRDGSYWGPEDPRVFTNPKGRTMLIYSRRDIKDVRAMYIFDTVSRKQVKLHSLGLQTQKNWTPLVYTSEHELILFYSMHPVELVSCHVLSGRCKFILRTKLTFFPHGVVLRGGSSFYHYRGDYYYSFARTVSKLVIGPSLYRPVLTIVKFNKDTQELDHVLVSSAFDFFGIPQNKIDPSTDRRSDSFRYMLPYSAPLQGLDMLLSLNIRDNANVVLRLTNVKKKIDAIINQYETINCDDQLASIGWQAIMTSDAKDMFTCQEKLRSIWRVAADSLLWNNAATCLSTEGVIPAVSENLNKRIAENTYPFDSFRKSNTSVDTLLIEEVVRLCAGRRAMYPEWLTYSQDVKESKCRAFNNRFPSMHDEFKCATLFRQAKPKTQTTPAPTPAPTPEPTPDPVKNTPSFWENHGRKIGLAALTSLALAAQSRQPKTVTFRETAPKEIYPTPPGLSTGRVLQIVFGIIIIVVAFSSVIIYRRRVY